MQERAWATDATPTNGGSCITLLPAPLGETLYRVAEHRGASLRLDGRDVRPGSGEERLIQRSAEMDSSVQCLPWRATDSYLFHKRAHINLQEARAIRKEICL